MLTNESCCHILDKENKAGTDVPSPAAIANGSRSPDLLKERVVSVRIDDSDGVKRSDFYFPPKSFSDLFVI